MEGALIFRVLGILLLLVAPLLAQETRLVRVESHPLGTLLVVEPSFDFTVAHRQVYALPKGWSMLDGFKGQKIRLRADYEREQVRFDPLSPPAQPAPADAWRGEMALESRGNQLYSAELGRTFPPYGKPGIYRLTVWSDGCSDPMRVGDLPPPVEVRSPLVVQVSEHLLEESLMELLLAHPQGFELAAGSLRINRLGATLLGGQPRLIAELQGQVGGTPWVQLVASVPAKLQFRRSRLLLLPDLARIEFEVLVPYRWSLPREWTGLVADYLQGLMGQGLELPVPEIYARELVQSGLITEDQVDNFRLQPVITGDRRHNELLLYIDEPSAPLWAYEPLRHPHELGVSLSSQAFERIAAHQLSQFLPYRVKLPREAQPTKQVFIFTVRVKEVTLNTLELAYQQGRLLFNRASFDLHWDAGLVNGVEPGASVWGSLKPVVVGRTPLRWQVEPEVTRVQFLSPRFKKLSAREKEKIIADLRTALRSTPLEVPLAPRVPVPALSFRAGLELTDMEAQTDFLKFRGRLITDGRN